MVMKAIWEVKAGNTGPDVSRLLAYAAESLVASGAQGVIAGCTEIPIVLKNEPAGTGNRRNQCPCLAAVKEALGRA